MAKKLYGHNSFVGGQVDHVLIGKAENTLSYARNVISSLRGELRPRTGTKHLLRLPNNTVVVPFRSGDSDKLCLFDSDGLKIYNYVDGQISECLNGAPAAEFVQDWTSNTTNGYSVLIHGLGISYNDDLSYQAFKGEGMYDFPVIWSLDKSNSWISFGLPADSTKKVNKFHVSFTSYQTITKVESITRYNGFKNAILQYSDDDGNTWMPIKTLQLNYKEYDSVFAAMSGPHKNQRKWLIEYDLISQDPTPHKLYRIFFLSESFVQSSKAVDQKYVRIKPYLQEQSTQPFSAEWELTDEQLQNLKYSQFENRLYLTTYPQTHPKLLQLDGDIFSFVDYTPTKPAAANFWETNGYPSCVRHFQGRLLFGGFDTTPARIVGSRFLDETDFQLVSTNSVATDPIDATCNELKSQIQNIYGGTNALYVLSNDGVSMINASAGVLAPTDINFRLRNVAPASGITPTTKNDIMLYTGADLTKIYSVEYDLLVERYKTNNEAWKAQDFFSKQVKEIHYIEDKERFVYCVMADGTFAAVLFEQAGIFSVYPCETQGIVLDACPIKVNDTYFMTFITERDDGYNLELKNPEYTSTHDFILEDYEQQEIATNNIMNVQYVDCVKTVNINNYVLPDPITFNAEDMTITTTDNNNNVYNMLIQSGCEMHLTDLSTNTILKVVIAEKTEEENKIKVYLTTESEIITTQTFYAVLTAQTIAIPTTYKDGTSFEVVGDNQYIGDVDCVGGLILLPKPLWNMYYGLPYEKEGIITVVGNMMGLKTWGTIAVNLQDTLHLEIGADKKRMEKLVEYRPTDSQYNTVPVMYNGVAQKNIADRDEYIKNLIFYSNKGLPFCVVGLLADGSVSDTGGN